MGRLESLQNSSGKAKCDRCGFNFLVSELVEDERTGLVLCQKDVDQLSFNDEKGERPTENVNHHFKT